MPEFENVAFISFVKGRSTLNLSISFFFHMENGNTGNICLHFGSLNVSTCKEFFDRVHIHQMRAVKLTSQSFVETYFCFLNEREG